MARPTHRTKDWAELAGCGLAHPAGWQEQPEPERGNWDPREASYTKLQAGFIANQYFLGFWKADIAGRVADRDQLPRRDTQHTWEGAPIAHPENWVDGTGEVTGCSLQLGVTLCAKHMVTWAARTWGGLKTQAQLSLHLCGVPRTWTWAP